MNAYQRFPQAMKRLFPHYLIACLVVSFVSPLSNAFAAANQLFISPSSSQMNIGTTFCIDIKSYAESDETTGTAVGTLNYPSGKLKVASIMTNGNRCSGSTSAHYGTPSISQQTGKITFNGSRSPAPSGIAQVMAIKFKAIGAGTATVSFADSSRVNSKTTTYGGGVYSITDPNPPPSPSPSSSPKPTPTTVPTPAPVVSKPKPSEKPQPSSTATPTPTPDPSGVISEVSVDSAYTSATVTWKIAGTNSKASFSYGISATALDKTTPVKKERGEFRATVTNLEPGDQYYFTIKGSGNGKNGTYSGTIYTRGYPVVLTITENNVIADNAQVRIGTLSRSVGSNGKLSLALAAGDYSGTITTDTATLTINLTVEKKSIPSDGSAPASQPFQYNLTSSVLEQGPGSGFSVLVFLGILAAGMVVLGIGFVGFVTYRRRRFELSGNQTTSNSSVVIDDGYNWQNNPYVDPESSKTQKTDKR